MTDWISSGEPRRSRLSLSVIRIVLPKPLTLALMRVVCARGVDLVDVVGRDAVGPRHAQDGLRDPGVVSRVTLLKIGHEDRRDEDRRQSKNRTVTTAPQIHQVRARRRTTPKSTIARTPPSTSPTSSALNWSNAPRTERLRGQSVLVLAEVTLVDREREAQRAGDHEVLRPVEQGAAA